MKVKRKRLTKTLVESLKPRPTDYTVWDSDVPQLGVRVRTSGTRHYRVRLRVDGRQRWYRIGKHGAVGRDGKDWTPDTARAEARRLLGLDVNVRALRATGSAPASVLHPVEAREHSRSAVTLTEFAERYLEDHAIPHKAPGSVEADRGLLGLRTARAKERETKPRKKARTILGALGRTRLDRISRADVTRLHLAWKDTPTRANRALALLSHMFTMAEKWGLRADGSNPCRHVERFKEGRRERYLSADELARLGKALAAAEKKGELTPFGIAAIRLLVFTGARASEVLGLTWEQLDGAGPAIRVPRKGRTLSLYLPPPALEVLAKLPRFEGNPFVIAGRPRGRRRDEAPEERPMSLAGLEQVWRVVRDAAELEDVRLHDLRHSFASVAVASGDSLPVIGALLGHTQPATTARYAHLSDDPLQAAANRTAAVIAAAMGPAQRKRAQAKVTPLRRKRR